MTKHRKKTLESRVIVEPRPEYVLDDELIARPEVKPQGAKPIYFPFDVMDVGKSFTTHRTLGTLRKAMRRFRDAAGGEVWFTARALPQGGCRVWRVK